MPIRELLINWTVANSRNAVSVLHFDTITKTDSQLPTAVADAILHQVSLFALGTKAYVDKGGKVFDQITGEYLEDWGTSAAPVVVSGTQNGSPVPNSAMGLLRFSTAVIADNRRIKGRTFIPGLAAVGNANGELNDPTMAGLAALGAEWVAAGLAIWHRPVFVPKTGERIRDGLGAQATAASVWREYAVQRRRRG